MAKLPETIAYVRVTKHSWEQGIISGEISASDFIWEFEWRFRYSKKLIIKPSQGRALIQEPLGRFLEKSDYKLEPGGDYSFIVRANF